MVASCAGLDPRIHHFRKMDCRIKSGNDAGLSWDRLGEKTC
jgi:hypothetical protein